MAKDFAPSAFPILPTHLKPRQQVIRKDVFVFQCPMCHKLFRYDDRYEPMCTGPSEMRDEHAPEVMRYLRTESRIIQL